MQRDQVWYFIINPTSGQGKGKIQWTTIESALLQHQVPYDNVFTQHKLHALDLAKTAIENGYRKIVAVGGDGTNNEVVNGIMEQKTVPSTNILHTLFPIGTGNDWVRQYHISNELETWIQMLKMEYSTVQNVGKVTYYNNKRREQRYFVNVAGMAYDAYVGKALYENQGASLKRLRFLYLTVACLFKYQLRKAHIRFDDKEIKDYFYLINAGICKYSGGGMQLVPHAQPDDGQLAITIARNLNKWNVIKSLPLLYNGNIDQHSLISIHKTKKITVEAIGNQPTLLEVDGEFLGETPVEISIIEAALKIVIPKPTNISQ